MSIAGSEPIIVKTMLPDPSTIPLLKKAAFFLASQSWPMVFPPMVKVIVVVGEDEVWLHLYSDPTVQSVNEEIVVRAPASLFPTWKPVTVTAPSTTEPEVAV